MFTYGIHNIEESYGSSTPQEVIFGSEPNKTFSPIDDPYQLSTPFGVKAAPGKILKRRSETLQSFRRAHCSRGKLGSYFDQKFDWSKQRRRESPNFNLSVGSPGAAGKAPGRVNTYILAIIENNNYVNKKRIESGLARGESSSDFNS